MSPNVMLFLIKTAKPKSAKLAKIFPSTVLFSRAESLNSGKYLPFMKKLLLAGFSFILAAQVARAQMDERFYFPSKTLEPMTNVKYQDFSLQTDTVTLTGIVMKPEKKPKATVLLFHGAGGNVSKYTFMAQPLVANGYQVFLIDFRGYGKSTGKPTHLNIAQDGKLFLDYALKRKDVAGTPVILYGASIGTQVATKLAREYKNQLSGLVLDGGMSSFTELAAAYAPAPQKEMILSSLPSPYMAKEDIKATENLPKLFIHSKEDRDVPYALGETVFNAAPEPKEIYVYSGKHLEAMKTNSAEIVAKMDAMLKKKKKA